MDAYPRRVKKVGAGFVSLAPTRQAASIGVFSLSVFSNRKPAQRLRFEKEEQRRELAPTYKKLVASDMPLATSCQVATIRIFLLFPFAFFNLQAR